jgi:hypothetical protein
VAPTDFQGNPYTFYGYIRKALDYEISEYDASGNLTNYQLLEPDLLGNINPQKSVTKEEFLKMSYIALKSNSCSDINESELALAIVVLDKVCQAGDSDDCALSDLDDPQDTYDFEPEVE